MKNQLHTQDNIAKARELLSKFLVSDVEEFNRTPVFRPKWFNIQFIGAALYYDKNKKGKVWKQIIQIYI